MTGSTEADLAAPKDPAAYRPRAMLGWGFWAVIAFGILCVLAGAGVWALAPRLLAQRPAERVAAAPSGVAAPRAPVLVAAPELSPAATFEAAPPDSADVAGLAARITALEAQQARTAHAAAAALAAAALIEASQGTRPFPEEAAALRAVSPATPELAQLSKLAEAGAPSRASLAASFPEYAARAASAARQPGEGASLKDRIVYALSRIVMVRRVGEVAGGGPDAQLARAERFVDDGDLESAFAALDRVPPAAAKALAPWRLGAERRAEIDRYAAVLRARALQDVAGAARSGA